MKGRLFLVPTPLDHGCAEQTPLDDVLPLGTIKKAAAIACWVSENAKSTRAFLKRVDALVPLAQPIQTQQITELPRELHKKGDHAGAARFDARPLLVPALQGQDVGLISEAGMPAVADPGSSIVRAAHELKIEVVPLVGPVSILLALAASGLNGQNFAFVGYLPQEASSRALRIRELETLALKTGQTQLFIETPYRNRTILHALIKELKPNTRLSICAGLTLGQCRLFCQTIGEWQRQPAALAAYEETIPVVFALGP